VEQRAQERQGGLAVVDVPRPILHPQHLPALRLVRADRVVARDLAPMGIEAPLRPRDLQAGRHYRPVDVDRQPPLPGLANGAGGDEGVDPLEMWEMARPKPRQPAPDRTRRGQMPQPAEPQHDGIAVEVAQVAKAAPAAQHQREHHEHQPEHAVVGRGEHRRQLAAEQRQEPVAVQPAPHELQAGVRREAGALVSEHQVPIDPGSQFRF
jgi:hypothetical protein